MDNNKHIDISGKNAQVNICQGGTQNVYNDKGRIVRSIKESSSSLRSWYSYIYSEKHIDRDETEKLHNWIMSDTLNTRPENRVCLLVGDAGSGKSVVMRDLLIRLEAEDVPVLGLKSDLLFSTSNTYDLDLILNLGKSVNSVIGEYAEKGKIVVLVDQIDALSSALTSKRGPLHSINTMVHEISLYENVRVVVSCRPYDQQYDPQLERYKLGLVVSMNYLKEKDVDETLALANITINENETEVKEFLRNPLNLFLFCRLKNGGLFSDKHPNRTILYEALWRQTIESKAPVANMVTSEELINCLDSITDEMYNRQSLFLPTAFVNYKFLHEISYLSSNSLLYNNDGNVQFIHQSLYDFVYAHLFLKNGKSIADILTGVHQGLFVRLRLKQILFYLRDTDTETYLRNLRNLLFAKDENGYSLYRFHLKHLMLTNIGFLKHLYDSEKSFIIHNILNNNDFSAIYLDSINTTSGLEIYRSHIDNKGGFSILSEDEQIQYINACERVLYDDSVTAVKYLLELANTNLKDNPKKRLIFIIDRIIVTKENLKYVISLVEKIKIDDIGNNLDSLMINLVEFDPEYVREKILANIQLLAKDQEETFSALQFSVNHGFERILDTIKEKRPDVAYNVVVDIIKYISTRTVFASENDKIKTSRAFYLYERNSDYPHFLEEQLDYLLNKTDELAKSKELGVVQQLEDFANADLATLVLVAVSAFIANIDIYKNEAFALMKRLLSAEFSSTVLDYYSKKLFESLWSLLDQNEQDELMVILNGYSPEWEKERGRLAPGRPITYYGYSRAQYYDILGDEELIKYPEAKKFHDEKKRTFHNLENQIPSKTQTMSGWRAIGNDFYSKASVNELVKTMIEINSDRHLDWNKPTKTGNALSIKQLIHERPDDVYDAYFKAMTKNGIDLDYPLYGIEEFINIGYEQSKIDNLVTLVISQFNPSLSDNNHSQLIQASRLLESYNKSSKPVPDVLFDFVCQIASNWDDSEYDSESGRSMTYNDGINQVRGCAASELFKCAHDRDRANRIFEVYEIVAKNGTIPTRAAILFRLGSMVHINIQRCFSLFIALTHDYAPALLSLPIHNLNPLLTFISTNFNELKDYFRACIETPQSHKVNVTLLWFAWIRGKDGAEDLMYAMADSSETARSELIRTITEYYNKQYETYYFPILYKYIDINESKTGAAYDLIFHNNIKLWNKNEKTLFIRHYAKSDVCKYGNAYFPDYLSELSKTDPELCLELLPDVYNHWKGNEEWFASPSKLIDILISSYNSIKEYDRANPVLEKALDLLDEWLHDNINRLYLFNCFKLLDN